MGFVFGDGRCSKGWESSGPVQPLSVEMALRAILLAPSFAYDESGS